MLVLSRKLGERLLIGDDVVLIVNKIAGNRVTLAIEAPNHVRIVRGELAPLENGGPLESPSDHHAQTQDVSETGTARQLSELGVSYC